MRYQLQMRFADDDVTIDVPSRFTFTVKNAIGLQLEDVRPRGPRRVVASVGVSEAEFVAAHPQVKEPDRVIFHRALDPDSFDVDLAAAFVNFERFAVMERLGRLRAFWADAVDLTIDAPGLDSSRARRLVGKLLRMQRTNVVVNGERMARRWL